MAGGCASEASLPRCGAQRARRALSPARTRCSRMTDCRLDVLCIGNAIVDVIADADDAFLDREGLTKGSMRLIDAEEAERLYSHMGPAREISGGSAANTAAGVAALGARAGFIGQVAPDQLGGFYRHDLTAAGVEFTTEAKDFGIPTARSMILVTPDGHRTMNTFLGAAQHLAVERARRGADPLGRDPLSRRLSVGPGDAALCDGPGDRGCAGGRPQGRLHAVGQLLRRPPPRRLQRADRRGADRHPLRQ